MTNVTADLVITSLVKVFSYWEKVLGSDVGITRSLTGAHGGGNDEPLTAHDWRIGGG